MPDLKTSKPKLSSEKAEAFKIFKESYPAAESIDSQKDILKALYGDAKKLGESAHKIRSKMSKAC